MMPVTPMRDAAVTSDEENHPPKFRSGDLFTQPPEKGLLAGSSGWGDRFAERSDGEVILLAERRPMGRAAVKDALERARRACP